MSARAAGSCLSARFPRVSGGPHTLPTPPRPSPALPTPHPGNDFVGQRLEFGFGHRTWLPLMSTRSSTPTITALHRDPLVVEDLARRRPLLHHQHIVTDAGIDHRRARSFRRPRPSSPSDSRLTRSSRFPASRSFLWVETTSPTTLARNTQRLLTVRDLRLFHPGRSGPLCRPPPRRPRRRASTARSTPRAP